MVDIRSPSWVAPQKIFVLTSIMKDATDSKGVFEVDIGDDSFDFLRYIPNAFPHYISSLKYNQINDRLLIVYNDGSGSLAASARLMNETVIIDKELASSEWNPIGILAHPTLGGVIFYGQNPTDGVYGFYWHHTDPTYGNIYSLLYGVVLTYAAGRGFDISADGKELYFGIPLDLRNTLLQKLDISQTGTDPEIIVELEGNLVSVRVNPFFPSLLLVAYQFLCDGHAPPGSRADIIDLNTLEARNLNIRTHRALCRFTKIEQICWSPDGHHFSFTQGTFDGEGGDYPSELWIYKDAVP